MDFDRFFSLFFSCGACFYGAVLRQTEKDKRWQVMHKKNGWVIRFFYRMNVMRKRKDEDFRFPKNTCQLYRGIYLGILYFFLIPPFVFSLMSVFLWWFSALHDLLL